MFNEYINYHRNQLVQLEQQIKQLEHDLEVNENQKLKIMHRQGLQQLQPQQASVFIPYATFPIGIASTNYSHKFEATRQPMMGHSSQSTSTISLFKEINLQPNTYVLITFVFDRNFTFRNAVLAPKQTRRVGLFSSRSPHRPNQLGQSIGYVVAINQSQILIEGLDLLDGTPVIAISIYQQWMNLPDSQNGWLNDKLLNLHYDNTDTGFKITGLEKFDQQLEFIQTYTNIDAKAFILGTLERIPALTRTHKEKQGGVFVLGVGIFRVSYEFSLGEVNIVSIKSSISLKVAESQKDRDPESKIAYEFVLKFGE